MKKQKSKAGILIFLAVIAIVLATAAGLIYHGWSQGNELHGIEAQLKSAAEKIKAGEMQSARELLDLSGSKLSVDVSLLFGSVKELRAEMKELQETNESDLKKKHKEFKILINSLAYSIKKGRMEKAVQALKTQKNQAIFQGDRNIAALDSLLKKLGSKEFNKAKPFIDSIANNLLNDASHDGLAQSMNGMIANAKSPPEPPAKDKESN